MKFGPVDPALVLPLCANETGWVAVPEGQCYCPGWYEDRGSDGAQAFAQGMEWFVMFGCIGVLTMNAAIYLRMGRSAVSWEVCYVMSIVWAFYAIELSFPYISPVMVFLNTGNSVVMLRYGQWLFATPVLLVLVADMGGTHKGYSNDDIYMVIADIFAVTIFVFGCLSTNVWVKLITYTLSALGFTYLFIKAEKCFKVLEAEAPTKSIRTLVSAIRVVFHVGWNLHTLFSTIGPEMLGWLNPVPIEIFACFSDLVAKVMFCTFASVLRLLMTHHASIKTRQDSEKVHLVDDALLSSADLTLTKLGSEPSMSPQRVAKIALEPSKDDAKAAALGNDAFVNMVLWLILIFVAHLAVLFVIVLLVSLYPDGQGKAVLDTVVTKTRQAAVAH